MGNTSTLLGRKTAWGERTCRCCDHGYSKRDWKRIERQQWRRDVDDEMNESSDHAPAIYEVLNEEDCW